MSAAEPHPSPLAVEAAVGTAAHPPRPRTVPASAIWVADEEEWRWRAEPAAPDGDAPTSGGGDDGNEDVAHPSRPIRTWRLDGSLKAIGTTRGEQPDGLWWKFHPDGGLFGVGQYANGEPHGVHRLYASDAPTTLYLQSCCVPPGAWQLRVDYHHGKTRARDWFDRSGRRIQSNGELFPDLPAGVPATAWFQEEINEWEDGIVFAEGGLIGTRRRWSMDGVLRYTEDLKDSRRHGWLRVFAPDGGVVRESRYSDGLLDGPHRVTNLPAGTFADARITGERGTFDHDQAMGRWEYLDAGGNPVSARELGAPLDEASLLDSPALVNEARPADHWRTLARTLRGEGRVGEALLAAARATAASGRADDLTAAIETWTTPLASDNARAPIPDLVERAGDRKVPLVDAMKRGMDVPLLLRVLAAVLVGRDRAALDLVDAALILAPGLTEANVTRTLLRAALGDLPGAEADIDVVSAVSAEQASFLRLYLRAAFPRLRFFAAEVDLGAYPGEDELVPARDAAEIRATVMKYATRLTRLREALRARVADDVPFMIPDLTALLPDGPVPLAAWSFEMSAAEYAGAEDGEEDQDGEATPIPPEAPAVVTITVDEAAGVANVADLSVPQLLRQARADWSGLVWLCWAVGLDRVALPTGREAPAAGLGRAAVMSLERTWRCQDKLNTSGLLALTKGIPGFAWEGTTIDLLPAALADVPLAEYVEARSVFSWLCDPSNRSLWQDDLRQTS